MTQRLAVCLCLFFMATVVSSQEKVRELPPLPKGAVNVGDPAKIKAVLAREADLRDSTKNLDVKLAADLYTEDYLQMVMVKWCCVANKEQQLAALIQHKDTDVIYSITDEQVVVRIHGNTAVVTGVTSVKGEVGVNRLLFMNVWALEKGKWRIIGGSRKML